MVPNRALPEIVTHKNRQYRRTDRIVAFSDTVLDHLESRDGLELFFSRLGREIWGDLDCDIFLMNKHGVRSLTKKYIRSRFVNLPLILWV